MQVDRDGEEHQAQSAGDDSPLPPQRPGDDRRQLEELLAEQKRTNRLLQTLIYAGIGFVLGLLAMQLLVRVRVF